MISRINSEVNQDPTTDDSSDDYALALEHINRGQDEWAQAYRWKSTKKTAFLGVTGSSQASISLPTDIIGKFGFAGPPALFINETPEVFEEIEPEDRRFYLSTDRFVYTLGNDRDGWTAYFNPGTLASGASLAVYYHALPSSLATSTDTTIVPDPDFLVLRGIQYIYQSRQDERFPIVKSDADQRLARMIEDEVVGTGGRARKAVNRIFRSGFRPGRD